MTEALIPSLTQLSTAPWVRRESAMRIPEDDDYAAR